MADELDVLEGLASDVANLKKSNKAQLDKIEKEAKEQIGKLETQVEEVTKANVEYVKQVTQLNEDAKTNGQTIKQLQDEVLELKAKGGRMANVDGEKIVTAVSLLKQEFTNRVAEIKAAGNSAKVRYGFDIKAAGDMTVANNLTGNAVATYSLTPAIRGRRKLHFRDLVDVINSETGIWKFYRENKPTGEGSFLTQTPGALKSQVDKDLTEVTVTADYLAGYARIAKQMLQDLPFMQSYLPASLVEDYLRAEDYKFFQALITAASGNTSGVTSTVSVEKVIQGIAALAEDDYEANGVVVTNQVWAKILNTKPNDYSLPAGGAVTISPSGDVMIVGIPLFRTNSTNIGANQMIIGDWTQAKIIQTDGLSVNMYEQDQDNVIRNLITVKAEARVGLAILRTDAFIYTPAGTT